MQYNKVEICGVNTSKLKVLTEKEKMELLRRVKEGDTKAREDLINGNLRLVLSVIQRFTNRGENLDDLFQVGCIGLIKAIDHFGAICGTIPPFVSAGLCAIRPIRRCRRRKK